MVKFLLLRTNELTKPSAPPNANALEGYPLSTI